MILSKNQDCLLFIPVVLYNVLKNLSENIKDKARLVKDTHYG